MMNRHGTTWIRAFSCLLGAVIASPILAVSYELSRTTVDGGGAVQSSGGAYTLSGTIAQPDAGLASAGAYVLTGGFWFEEPPGDCNATGMADLLDHADFADCLTGPGGGLPTPDCNCFDVDGDNDADLLDFAELQVALGS